MATYFTIEKCLPTLYFVFTNQQLIDHLLLSSLVSTCWGGRIVSLLVNIFIPLSLSLFFSSLLRQQKVMSKLTSVFHWTWDTVRCKMRHFYLPLRWKTQGCLSCNVMLSYHLEFLFFAYQKNSFRLRHIFIIFHTCTNIKSKT